MERYLIELTKWLEYGRPATMKDFFPLLRALGLVVVLLSLAGYGWQRWQQHRATRAINQVAARHATRAAADAAARQPADSARLVLTGRLLESQRTHSQLLHRDDSLSNRLPAAPELPAQPARY